MTKRWILFAMALLALAQPPSSFVATVQAVRPEQGELDVKLDQGEVRSVKTIPESMFRRVAPGEKDLKNAQTIQIGDVGAGDRVLVTLEPGTTELRRLVVMSASDIGKRNEADRQDWVKRGVSGVVVAKDGNHITLKMRSLMTETPATVTVSDKTSYRRYAPDSVKFADAKESSLQEIGVGDQVRARGQKSDDGSQVAAEEIVFGTFLTKAGKITAINPESNEIAVSEIGSNKPLVIKLTADSQIRRMPPAGPAGGPPGAMPGGMRPPDVSQMLDKIPPAQLADLEPGQTVIVSSTKGGTSGQVTAITLLANADMLIRMATMQQGGARPNGASASQLPSNSGPNQSGMMGGVEGLQIPGMIP